MSSPTTHVDVLKASEHLPSGATLVIHEFGWDDYERLVEAIGDHSGLRVSYDGARLEVLSPSSLHDRYAWYINLLIYEFCRGRSLSLQGNADETRCQSFR